MFTVTKDALVEITSMIRVAKTEDGNKVLFCFVKGTENRFLLTPNDCRHVAALLRVEE